MIKFSSLKVRNKITEKEIKPFHYLADHNKVKYLQALDFMADWSKDLLLRQNQLYRQQKGLIQQSEQLSKENRSLLNQKINQKNGPPIDIDRIVRQQFVKRIQSLFMKQVIIENQFSAEESSYNIEISEVPSQNQSDSEDIQIQNYTNKCNPKGKHARCSDRNCNEKSYMKTQIKTSANITTNQNETFSIEDSLSFEHKKLFENNRKPK